MTLLVTRFEAAGMHSEIFTNFYSGRPSTLCSVFPHYYCRSCSCNCGCCIKSHIEGQLSENVSKVWQLKSLTTLHLLRGPHQSLCFCTHSILMLEACLYFIKPAGRAVSGDTQLHNNAESPPPPDLEQDSAR